MMIPPHHSSKCGANHWSTEYSFVRCLEVGMGYQKGHAHAKNSEGTHTGTSCPTQSSAHRLSGHRQQPVAQTCVRELLADRLGFLWIDLQQSSVLPSESAQ